jgi:hypothetical protein
MTRVRFLFSIKSDEKGKGVPLLQLGRVAEEAAKFFRSLSDDLTIEFKPEDWLAVAPRRGSFAFDIESRRELPPKQARSVRAAVTRVARYKPPGGKPPENLRRETLTQYAKIGAVLDIGQTVEISAYQDDNRRKPVGEISKTLSKLIIDTLAESVEYYGSVQGRPYSLTIGSSPEYFLIRELSTGTLIRCEFKPERHSDVVSLFRKVGTVVLVGGNVYASRAHKSIIKIAVNDLQECEDITQEEFDSFFGSAPQLTGDLSTDEFVDMVRRDE